jgi:transposase-like protein
MKKETTTKGSPSIVEFSDLERFARQQVQEFLQRVLEEEVTRHFGRDKYERRGGIAAEAEVLETKGQKRQGYRNGYGKPRSLTTSMGTVEVRRPRVRGLGEGEEFESKVLPLFVSRTKGLDEALVGLYLHGLSLGDFDLALRGLLGSQAPISSSTLARLKESWLAEYKDWKAQTMVEQEVVYLWVDGIYVKAGLEREKGCLLVALAGLSNGKKVFLAIESGYRESKESWSTLLRDLKQRGLQPPRLVIGDGALGIWAALSEVFPFSGQQRCWNHRKINILNQIPDKAQSQAIELLKSITSSETEKQALKARVQFQDWAKDKGYDKAAQLISHDWDRMTAYFNFPKEHWKHLKTTNPIESPFASARLRTDAAKRFKKADNATAMLFKLLTTAEKTFRKLQHPHLLPEVFAGAKYKDGVRLPDPPESTPQTTEKPNPQEVAA